MTSHDQICLSRAWTLVLCVLVVGMGLIPVTARADQMTMKNGDRITGTIVKQDGKTVTVKSEYFGVVTAPWDQVVSIVSDQQVNVVLKDGRKVVGSLATNEGQVVVTTADTKTGVAMADVATIRNADEQAAYERMLSPGFFQLWTGGASIGWAGTRGNAETSTFTGAVNAARVTNTDKTSVYFNLIKASAQIGGTEATTAQAVRAGIGYGHNVSSRLFVSAFNDYEYDRFQDLDLRFVAGGGFGFHAYKSEHSSLDLVGGADYNHSTFSTLTRSQAEAFWGNDFALKLTGASSLVQTFRMFNNLSDTGNYRVNLDVGLSTKLKSWISWNLSLSDRYLSNPVDGRKSNDWLYSTGLGLTFGK